MLLSLPFVVAAVALLGSGDSTKKKPANPPAPPKAPAAPAPSTGKGSPRQTVALAGATVEKSASAVSKAPLLGAAISRKIVETARAVAPRTTYLNSAIRSRAMGGPELPPHATFSKGALDFYADSIVVEKSRRTMTLYHQGTPVRIYFVALGQSPVGDKVSRGDNRTPEGLYYIEGHNPGSKYHLSLRVSYPNAQDVVEARSRGLAAGGDIMIHGLPKGFEKLGPEHRQRDWTNGCIAVTNAEIEEIWRAIPDGAAIHIKP